MRGPTRLRAAILLSAVCLSVVSWAGQQAPPTAGTVRVTTRLVLVDVVVTDKEGRPVTDLKREDFTLLEDGKAQEISVFSFEQASLPTSADTPTLPEHVYSNQTAGQARGPLNIILLDFLNTPAGDQAHARDQILKYLQTNFQPQQRTALLVLTDRLYVLQDFTTDPEKLRAAAERATPQDSLALMIESPFQVAPEAIRNVPNAELHFTIPERMNMVLLGMSADARARQTLSAVTAIAQNVAGYPGRKNLIWVSSGFPFTILPEQLKHDEFQRNYLQQVKQTAALLTVSQVAVYPIDPRGLAGYAPDLEGGQMPARQDIVAMVEQPGSPYRSRDRAAMSRTELQGSHAGMKRLAEDSGGRAFTNRSDLGTAVTEAVADGSQYYSLGFYPAAAGEKSKQHKIEVRLARKGVDARYRRGYEVLEAADRSERSEEEQMQELMAALASSLPPTAIAFQSRVLPPAASDPAAVTAEFLVDVKSAEFTAAEDGRRLVSLDVLAAGVDAERNIVASASRRLDFQFPADVFERLREQGLPYKLELSVPPGSYQLKLLVRDNLSGRLGRVDVPLEVRRP